MFLSDNGDFPIWKWGIFLPILRIFYWQNTPWFSIAVLKLHIRCTSLSNSAVIAILYFLLNTFFFSSGNTDGEKSVFKYYGCSYCIFILTYISTHIKKFPPRQRHWLFLKSSRFVDTDTYWATGTLIKPPYPIKWPPFLSPWLPTLDSVFEFQLFTKCVNALTGW